jgi:hypothetical protein
MEAIYDWYLATNGSDGGILGYVES